MNTSAAQAASMLSPDGRCKVLDCSADGYVRGESCVVVQVRSVEGCLKPQGAVLLGTFVNQDGRSSSLTAPNGPSQQQVRECLLGLHQSVRNNESTLGV